MTYRCGDSAPPRAPENLAPKTRGVEVAPGVFVAPEGYAGPVLWVYDVGVLEPRSMLSAQQGATHVDASAAEVAAKLWPVETGKRTADQVRHQVSLTLERLVLDREQGLISPADVMSVIRKMQISLQDEAIHGEQS